MKLFKIPLWERFTWLGGSLVECNHAKYMKVDKVGLLVHYAKESDATPEKIRSHLAGLRMTHCLIEANSKGEALAKFYKEYEGTKIGGKKKTEKALFVRKGEKVEEVSVCERRNKNKRKEYICGEEDGLTGSGRFGMCTLEGYDFPEGCPLEKSFF